MSYDKSLRAVITNIQKFCIDDGPGIRTTVFLKGCPLRCIWCHNPETYSRVPQCMQRAAKCTSCGRCAAVCPSEARKIEISDGTPSLIFDREKCTLCGKCVEACLNSACEICGKEMTVEEVIKEVEKDKMFYETSGGGMTVSGGECSMMPDFTLSLIEAAKEKEIGTYLETSGHGKTEFFIRASELGAAFLYDIKAADNSRHREFCGVGNELIMKNAEELMKRGANITFRLPLVPGVNDTDRDLTLLKEFLDKNSGRYTSAQIMPYHSMGLGKAESLGITQLTVPHELFANECESSRSRWHNILGI